MSLFVFFKLKSKKEKTVEENNDITYVLKIMKEMETMCERNENNLHTKKDNCFYRHSIPS